jgi:hypothetical protein
MKNQLLLTLCLLITLMTACKDAAPKEEAKAAAPAVASAPTVTAPVEFADMKYADILKTGQAALAKGDVTAWMTAFADNAVYAWGNGDSLAGKPAITQYWTKRRAEVIDSISFSNHIFLPIKVNNPQSVEAPGIWVLSWYMINAKYKPSGKRMVQWSHADAHFNADGKIDRLIQYLDMAKVNAAMKK